MKGVPAWAILDSNETREARGNKGETTSAPAGGAGGGAPAGGWRGWGPEARATYAAGAAALQALTPAERVLALDALAARFDAPPDPVPAGPPSRLSAAEAALLAR